METEKKNEAEVGQTKTNFTPAMTSRLVELVKENYDDIEPGTRRADAAKTKSTAWARVTSTLNAENKDNFKTVGQVMEKWKNVKKNSKKTVGTEKRFKTFLFI
jgi:hypothetical protein